MWDPERYARALDLAARCHGDQRDPGNGFPYVVHLTKVAAEVMRVASPELNMDLAVTCAVLHDIVEDAGVSVGQLEAEFGAEVAAGVAALTKDERLPKEARMADSLRRLQAQPREVQLVKLADRITNLEYPPRYWTAAKRRAYLEEAGRIHEALGAAHLGLAARLIERMRRYEAWIGEGA